MASVYVGSARIDENGKANSGNAGDQTGKELSTQSWYKHSKGWRVFRAKDQEKATKIARAMEAACNNSKIGYDQWQRDTLYNAAKKVDFDPAKVTTACETDCSALVRVCCAYAGIMVGNFRTYNQASMLLGTDEFVELTGSKYTDQDTYLGMGDILVTKTSGHTVVVLTNGSKYEGTIKEPTYILGDRMLKIGMSGTDVKELQTRLKGVGFNPGDIDGEYGPQTEGAVKALQQLCIITVDGDFGPASLAALLTLEPAEDESEKPTPSVTGKVVKVTGDSVYIRTGPSKDYDAVDIAHEDDKMVYANPDGWLPVIINSRIGWVSGKYGVLEDD